MWPTRAPCGPIWAPRGPMWGSHGPIWFHMGSTRNPLSPACYPILPLSPLAPYPSPAIPPTPSALTSPSSPSRLPPLPPGPTSPLTPIHCPPLLPHLPASHLIKNHLHEVSASPSAMRSGSMHAPMMCCRGALWRLAYSVLTSKRKGFVGSNCRSVPRITRITQIISIMSLATPDYLSGPGRR